MRSPCSPTTSPTTSAAKLPASSGGRVHVIPNFVDTDAIVPGDRMTAVSSGAGARRRSGRALRRQRRLLAVARPVLAAARELPDGDVPDQRRRRRATGARTRRGRAGQRPVRRLHRAVADSPNCWRPATSTSSPLKRGLARVSVPSKTYSIMAAARPVLASIDPDTAVPTILAESGGGVAVPPDDTGRLRPARCAGCSTTRTRPTAMGRRGRAWVEREASPAAVGDAYHQLIDSLAR